MEGVISSFEFTFVRQQKLSVFSFEGLIFLYRPVVGPFQPLERLKGRGM